MADKNERGLYPVISISDGMITNLGWLEKGGYRIGITSPSGVYYYYAHLESYAGIKEGDQVQAGEMLGFMGDSGYGEEGVRVRFVTEDKVGVLEQIIHLIVEEGYNIANTVNIPTKDDRVVIEVQIDGVTDLEGIRSKFEANGLKVDEITRTTAKAI